MDNGNYSYNNSDQPGFCMLSPDQGGCRGYFERYFYNSNTYSCEMFIYGGCGGKYHILITFKVF